MGAGRGESGHGLVSNPFGDIVQWVTDVIEALGYGGVAFLVALENVVPPIPSEVILPLAGFLAGQGRFWLPGVVLAATAGSVAGALLLYVIARSFGEPRIRRLIDRYGRWATIGQDDLDRAETWFDRHGPAVIFFGRLVPIVRSLVSLPAGFQRMPLGPFVLYTALGSGLWNGALIGLGWILGDRWEDVERYVGAFQNAVIAVALAAVAWFLWKRRPWRSWRAGTRS